MYLTKLKLINFKNYADVRVLLEGVIHCFVGKNGSGKTNLLDAIYYLSYTKSALNPSDQQNIRLGENQFFIGGEFKKQDHVREVACSYGVGQKKIVSEDGQEYERFSMHLGKYPVVLIAPNDIGLIGEGSELRRKFFDNLLCQLNPEYLENLIVYTSYLKQRNGLLRIFSERGNIDYDMLEVYDQKLIPAGNYIFEKRKTLLREFAPNFESHYKFLVGDSLEKVEIVYRSTLEEIGFEESLKKNLQRDILLQRTGSGVHRDDFLFLLNASELKRFGSQGQQKSFLIGLKLAEFEMISQHRNFKPLLLLDDIFDKLDDERIYKLMTLVAQGTFGQLFITDARASRSTEILEATSIRAQLFHVENGTLNQVHGKG